MSELVKSPRAPVDIANRLLVALLPLSHGRYAPNINCGRGMPIKRGKVANQLRAFGKDKRLDRINTSEPDVIAIWRAACAVPVKVLQ